MGRMLNGPHCVYLIFGLSLPRAAIEICIKYAGNKMPEKQ